MKKNIVLGLIVVGTLFALSSCAKKEGAEPLVKIVASDEAVKAAEPAVEHATVYQFNYDDAKELKPGEFIQFNRNGGYIVKLDGGYLMTVPNRDGVVFVSNEDFAKGLGE